MPIENPWSTTTIAKEEQRICEMLEIIGISATKLNHEKDGPTLQNLDLSDNEDEDSLLVQKLDPGTREDVAVDSLDILQDACIFFYVGARCSKLAATLTLMNMCTIHGCCSKFIDELFSILHKFLLPMNTCLSSSMHGVKTLTQHIGLKYNTIHASSYGCVLYRGEYANPTHCPKSGKERYKQVGQIIVPIKILCHFPLIPQLKYMYCSPTMSQILQWHAKNKSTNGMVHHFVNGKTWAHINEAWQNFGNELWNLMLAISTNGFNPFSKKLCTWSTWHVYILFYNLLPWLVTKWFLMLVSLIILGKENINMNNIDVFLTPLVEELKTFWMLDVQALDFAKPKGHCSFNLRAMVMSTINDFPCYLGMYTKDILLILDVG